ncbi:MAG: hypothetical protein LQ337_007722 [Flavoplaca oasis]|nr:MAG: hypothetical protein LQ337_007722 [Flavoplaca oasis]
MANHEQPYDPYIPSGRGTLGSDAHHDGGSDRTAALQAQIDDTVHVMRQNIQRTEQRGENIDNMVDKTNGLEERAKQFRRGANRVRKYEMWKNVRMWVWIILGLAVIALIIGLGRSTSRQYEKLKITEYQVSQQSKSEGDGISRGRAGSSAQFQEHSIVVIPAYGSEQVPTLFGNTKVPLPYAAYESEDLPENAPFATPSRRSPGIQSACLDIIKQEATILVSSKITLSQHAPHQRSISLQASLAHWDTLPRHPLYISHTPHITFRNGCPRLDFDSRDTAELRCSHMPLVDAQEANQLGI